GVARDRAADEQGAAAVDGGGPRVAVGGARQRQRAGANRDQTAATGDGARDGARRGRAGGVDAPPLGARVERRRVDAGEPAAALALIGPPNEIGPLAAEVSTVAFVWTLVVALPMFTDGAVTLALRFVVALWMLTDGAVTLALRFVTSTALLIDRTPADRLMGV